MYALTDAPAHLIIQVKAFGIGVYADPEDVEVPEALVGGRLTRFSDGRNFAAFTDLVSLLCDLGYTVVERAGDWVLTEAH